MNKLEWQPELQIGISAIDLQHQSLVEMINGLADNLAPGNVFDAVMQMYRYAEEHFTLEEELMRKCGYVQLQQHQKQHNLFKEKTIELAGLDYTLKENNLEVFRYLCDWFINHILHVDMEYKDCVLSIGNQQV